MSQFDGVDLCNKQDASRLVRVFMHLKVRRAVKVRTGQIQLVYQAARHRTQRLPKHNLALDGLGWLDRMLFKGMVLLDHVRGQLIWLGSGLRKVVGNGRLVRGQEMHQEMRPLGLVPCPVGQRLGILVVLEHRCTITERVGNAAWLTDAKRNERGRKTHGCKRRKGCGMQKARHVMTTILREKGGHNGHRLRASAHKLFDGFA